MLSSLVIAAAIAHSVWRARRELREARRLARYRLEAPIGKGGMNEVWLAWDDRLRRQLALKILRASDSDSIVLSRFEREAHATSRLSSPHTVRVYDYGATDDASPASGGRTCRPPCPTRARRWGLQPIWLRRS